MGYNTTQGTFKVLTLIKDNSKPCQSDPAFETVRTTQLLLPMACMYTHFFDVQRPVTQTSNQAAPDRRKGISLLGVRVAKHGRSLMQDSQGGEYTSHTSWIM